VFFDAIVANNYSNPCFENKAKVTSIPKSACTVAIFLVLKKPFKYAVAGYGVFS